MRKIIIAGLLSALCAVAGLAQTMGDDAVLETARRKYEAAKAEVEAAKAEVDLAAAKAEAAALEADATLELSLSGDFSLSLGLGEDDVLDGARREYAAGGRRKADAPPPAETPADSEAPVAETPAEPDLPFYPLSFTIVPGIGLFDGKAESAVALGLLASDVYSVKGIQIAPIFCLAPGGVAGTEIAGIFNIAGDVSGSQIAGIFNISGDVEGAQIAGIFNIAKKVSGIQIGLVNICDSLDGFSLGLINIVKDGINETGVFYDETGYGYAFAKFGTQKTYTLVYLGESMADFPGMEALTAGIGVGFRFGSMDRYIDVDASGKIFVGSLEGLRGLCPVSPYYYATPYTGSAQSFLSLRAAAGMKLFGLFDATVGVILETGIGSWSVVDPRYMGSSEFGFEVLGVPVKMYPKWFVSVAL